MKYLSEENIKKYIDTEEKLLMLSKSIVCGILYKIPFFKVGDVAIDEEGCLKEEYKNKDYNEENPRDESEKEERRLIKKIMHDYIKAVNDSNPFLIGYCVYTAIDINKKYTKKRFFQNYIEKFDVSFISYLLIEAINFNKHKADFEEKLNTYARCLNRIFKEINGTIFDRDFESQVIYALRASEIHFDNAFYELFDEDN